MLPVAHADPAADAELELQVALKALIVSPLMLLMMCLWMHPIS